MDIRAKLTEIVEHEVVPYFAKRIVDRLIENGVTIQSSPKTEADYIRVMSDSELAKLLVEEKEFGVCRIPFFRCPGGKDFEEDQYEEALRYTIDWLGQPHKED